MKNFLNYIYRHTNMIYKGLIFVSSLFLIVYFFPKSGKFKYEFDKNKPWQYETLYAPYDFSVVKDDESFQMEKDSIRKQTPYIVRLDKVNLEDLLSKTDAIIKQLRGELSDQDVDLLIQKNHQILPAIYETGLFEQVPDSLLHHSTLVIDEKNKSKKSSKLIDYQNIKNEINPYFKSNPGLADYLIDIYKNNLPTNVNIDTQSYQESLQKRLSRLSKIKHKLLKNALLIRKGEMINQDKYEVLNALKSTYGIQQQHKYQKLWIYSGYGILVAIVLLMLFMFLQKYRPNIFENNIKVSFIFFNILLMIILTTLVVEYDATYVFIVPLAILPLILKAFFDARIGLFVHVLTILLLGFVVPNSFEFIFLQIMAGIVTILTVSELTKRSNLFSSVGSIVLIYFIGYFAFHLIHEGSFEQINGAVFVMFLINGVLTIALSHQLILIYEKIFGLVSDVSLLELSNTNSKLLKRLADKAPGTFNHSLQVANLAEAAANEIGANSLLVRAGALYHDIGKMLNPFYFTENQTSGVNRHDDLDPIDSAQIIVKHVLDGIELARKNKIPDRIIDFIRTHHGTSLVQFFYKKALDQNPNVDKELFRYPGPNPFSKETAILMMADSVEAASKSLREPTAEKIDNFVDKIIDYQLHSGLLSNANITLKEINRIKKLFKKKLKNIYHLRVAYPE